MKMEMNGVIVKSCGAKVLCDLMNIGQQIKGGNGHVCSTCDSDLCNSATKFSTTWVLGLTFFGYMIISHV